MVVYFVLAILLILFYNLKRDKVTSNILAMILIALAAFRSASTGADTLDYIADYYSIMTSSWSYVTERYNGYLGYYYLCKLVSYIRGDVWIWFGVVETIFLLSILSFIRRFSTNSIYSLMIFVCNGLYVQSFNAQKQILALSFMLFAFVALSKKRSKKKYILVAGLSLYAFMCHPTAAVFFPAFFFYIYRNKKFLFPGALALGLFLIVAGQTFLNQATLGMFTFLDNAHFEDYLVQDNSYSNTTLIFYGFSLIIPFLFSCRALFSKNQTIENEKSLIVMCFMCCFLSCAFQGLSAINPTLFRLAYFYSPFFMVLIPNCSAQIRVKDNRKFLTIIMWVLYIFYFLYTNRNMPYEFC